MKKWLIGLAVALALSGAVQAQSVSSPPPCTTTCTIGTLTVSTGNLTVSAGSLVGNTSGGFYPSGFSRAFIDGAFDHSLGIVSSDGSATTYLTIPSSAVLQIGAIDLDVAVPQTLGVQNITSGISNTAGGDFKIRGSAGSGAGVGGKVIIQVAPHGTSGSTQNAFQSVLQFNEDRTASWLGTIPTVTGTGTPTITTGSTDTAGEVTGGTAATSIVVTFSSAKTNAPFCTVTSQTQLAAFAYSISTTAITITETATTGDRVDYVCFQH